MSLFAELKRRNVIRVAGFYVVAAWLLVQVASTLLPVFDAPAWAMKALVILLALGFVPALAISWAFELTPEGLKREHEVERSQSIVDQTARRLDVAVIAMLVAVGGLVSWNLLRDPTPTTAAIATASTPAASAKSIAVLAFDDLSAEGDQAYFAEGVSEELLNLLARIDGLKVAARTSSFKFKDGTADIGEIGRALNVDTVLEGSVRKAGDQVRVTAQLIRVSDGFHIWSQSYDRKLENIFAVQDEIAAAIVAALKLELDMAAPAQARTANVAAYDLYLQGRQLAREPSRAGLLRAIDNYEKAIALDPGFAAPYGGIAEAWIWLEDYGGERSAEAYPKAEQAARRALELDPRAAEALTAMAMVRDRMHNDSTGAQQAFEQALAINPSYVPAYNNYGDVLRDTGDYRRSIEVHRKAVELDPLSVFMKTRLANKLMEAGGMAEAEALVAALLAEDPDNDYALEELANLAFYRREFADAIATYQKVHVARPGDAYSASRIAQVGAYLDDAALAGQALAAARARGADNRWELTALADLASWQQGASQLERLAQQTGPRGARWRADVAARRDDWPQARVQLLEALQMSGYDAGRSLQTGHASLLIDMAWVEKQMDAAEWKVTAGTAESLLAKAASEGAVRIGDFEHVHFLQARLAAIRGERDATLQHLRAAIAQGFPKHWFLRNDPEFAAWRDDPAFMALVAGMLKHAAAERAKIAGEVVLP